jgi:hypothetical protein
MKITDSGRGDLDCLGCLADLVLGCLDREEFHQLQSLALDCLAVLVLDCLVDLVLGWLGLR